MVLADGQDSQGKPGERLGVFPPTPSFHNSIETDSICPLKLTIGSEP